MSTVRSKWILPTVAVVAVIALVAIYFIFQTPGVIKPKEVTLTGTATTTGTGSTPQKIAFTSLRNNMTYVASVSTGNPGNYTITLPNGDSYKVTITWKFLQIITGGTTDAGNLNLDTYETSIVKNWAC